MNVHRNRSRKFTYVKVKKRKIGDYASPPGLSSNAPQTQQKEDSLEYIDDLEFTLGRK